VPAQLALAENLGPHDESSVLDNQPDLRQRRKTGRVLLALKGGHGATT
jgi:hypothetical protein